MLMEAVVGTWASECVSEEGTWRRPRRRERVIGAGVIADGREGEVACIERLTERGGRRIVVCVPKVLLVVLAKEAHVVDRRYARPWANGLLYLRGLVHVGEGRAGGRRDTRGVWGGVGV